MFRALAGLLSVVVALVGAGMIASALAPPAARLVTPLIAKQIEQRVEDAMAVQSAQSGQVQMPEADTEGTQDQEAEDSVIQNLLAILGLDDEVRTQLAQRVRERIRSTGESLAAAVVESMAQSFLYGALYILSFAVLLAALKLVTRAMGPGAQAAGPSRAQRPGGSGHRACGRRAAAVCHSLGPAAAGCFF